MVNLEKLKTMILIEELEQGAQQQIYNALELDFLKTLAIMPDCHQGYTLPIGGVALLDGVISPEYVGYDIGCFVGSTKIPLPDGSEYTLKELYDKKIKNFPVYSMGMQSDHKIGIADGVKLTRKNAELVKIILDNDEEIICTPDHQFLNLDSKTYTEAIDLNFESSIFPFHRYLDRDGYEFLGVRGTTIAKPTAWVVAESGLIGDIPNFENGIQIHHIDKDKLNNFPFNLKFIDKIKHCSLHGKDRNYFATDDFKEKKKQTILERGYYFDPKYLKKKKTIAIKNIKEYMNNNSDHFKQVTLQNGIRGGKFFSNKNSDKQMIIKQKLGRIAKLLQKCIIDFGEINKENYETTRKSFYNYPLYNKAMSVINEIGYDSFEEFIEDNVFSNNHKIKSIIKLDYKEDVYCITVDGYHNFAISAGVFVHNCGMCCVVTDVPVSRYKEKRLKKTFDDIYKTIPVGVGVPRKKAYYGIEKFITASGDKDLQKKVQNKQFVQVGTLGAGNHFIEIGSNNDKMLTVTIHSGSRNPGHSIASYYMLKAKQEDKDLPDGFLHFNGDLGQAYLKDLNFGLQYALENRRLMMKGVLEILGFAPFIIDHCLRTMINENHNHAIVRDDGILHRKGATPAEKGTLGVIPGTMKSGVYITEGLGNEEYLSSASHGAGRVMSRTKAKKSIPLEKHLAAMKGIIAKVDKSTLDESHFAYKDLNVVVQQQDGIVIDIVDYVKPLINVKG